MNRPLTDEERGLVRWMLEHGKPEALDFLEQLDRALATPWRCPCGCASVNFSIDGCSAPAGGMNILSDYLFGNNDELSGVFVWEQNGVLAGLEVYGLTGDAPKSLPAPQSLRPLESH